VVFPILNLSQAFSKLSNVIMKDLYQLEAEAPILRQTIELYKEFCVYLQEKLGLLIDASAKFEVLKMLFRVARDLKMLDNKKYLSLETRIQEIGKMLGGWMRSLNLKTA